MRWLLHLTIAPGIWRHPEWILSEIERIARKHKTRTVAEAVSRVCLQQHWHFTITRTRDGAAVSLYPMQARAKVIDGTIDVDAEIVTAASVWVDSGKPQAMGIA